MNIIIGNIISFIAAIFMALSCIQKDRKHIFYFQTLNCFILAISSLFFGSYSGCTTMLISTLRNFIIARDKYTKPVMYVFLAVTTVSGILANNMGIIGFLPVIATIQYTVCLNIFHSLFGTRLCIFINTAIWVTYSFMIFDFSTALTDSISLITITATVVKMIIKKKN